MIFNSSLLPLILIVAFLLLFVLLYFKIVRSGERPGVVIKIPYASRVWSMINALLFYLFILMYLTLMTDILKARQQGLGITAALEVAIKTTAPYAIAMIIVVAVVAMLFILVLRKRWKKETEKSYKALEPLDERFRLVEGKAATTTIAIALGILFIAGTAYEVLFKGEPPIRTFTEIILIVIIWVVALQYWNRRL